MYDFTRDTAITILDKLKAMGYTIDAGLDDAEVHAVEKAFKAPLPPDLEILLRAGVIRKGAWQRDGVLPDWRSPDQEAVRYREYIEEHTFRFDIENNNYWSEQFGEKPKDTEKAVQQALVVIRTWPPLFPIFSHRFIPSKPNKIGNPILSVWQATDSVYYGANLLAYMNKEFKLGLNVVEAIPDTIPYWSKAFGLE
jgi:hypothetical protein